MSHSPAYEAWLDQFATDVTNREAIALRAWRKVAKDYLEVLVALKTKADSNPELHAALCEVWRGFTSMTWNEFE